MNGGDAHGSKTKTTEKRKGHSVQDLIGIKTFTKYGLATNKSELLSILLVAEFCEPQKRHIVSVFKIIQELLAPSQKKGKNQFQQLMEMLPNDHKAKWFAGAALNTAEQSMASVMSTALSRLNSLESVPPSRRKSQNKSHP